MPFSFIKIIFLFSFFFHPFEIKSNILIFDVSHQKVSISSDSKETNFTIYGFSDSPKNLVLKITGPNQKVVLQKKKKVFGMWTWNKTGEFSYPSLFHYYTNIKNNDIDFHVKKDLVDKITLVGKDDDNLKKELIDKKTYSFKRNQSPILVDSAFGGFGIYKMKYVLKNNRKYEGTQTIDLISKDQKKFRIRYQKCEHVNFNLGLVDQNLKLYILPYLINRDFVKNIFPPTASINLIIRN